MQIQLDFRFDSAHFLPYVPDGHKCKKLHGHTYHLTTSIIDDVNEYGWIMDFAHIRDCIQPILNRVDHCLLNAIPGLENPTVENISKYLYTNIKQVLPNLGYVTVHETPSSRCIYPGIL